MLSGSSFRLPADTVNRTTRVLPNPDNSCATDTSAAGSCLFDRAHLYREGTWTRPSSSGQDGALSRRKPGFDSPWAYQISLRSALFAAQCFGHRRLVSFEPSVRAIVKPDCSGLGDGRFHATDSAVVSAVASKAPRQMERPLAGDTVPSCRRSGVANRDGVGRRRHLQGNQGRRHA